jgi:hypothetical protein
VNADGFARPACEMPGPGPTWITGLVVLRDRQGKERMFANYAKIRPPMETYERGLVEFDPATQAFQKRAVFSMDLAAYPGETPGGHTFLRRESEGTEYIYYCNPFPLVRIPADPEALKDAEACEAFTCLAPGTRNDERKLDRAADGNPRYGWKKRTQVVSQQQQGKLVEARLMRPEHTLLNLRDVLTGKPVLAHGGSVVWNAYRRRWVLIAVEIFGSSLLGEIWFAEADTPLGPWVYARKIATHDDYSFYNPRQHPFFDQQGGGIIYFEGTYTSTFSGNKDPTPRYDYNQIMHQLDLADERLALPQPVYAVAADDSARRVSLRRASEVGARRALAIAFFAPDRPGIARLPLQRRQDARGVEELTVGSVRERGASGPAPQAFCYVLPADGKATVPGTVALYEDRAESRGDRLYSTGDQPVPPGYRRAARPIGLVWKNPGRIPPEL